MIIVAETTPGATDFTPRSVGWDVSVQQSLLEATGRSESRAAAPAIGDIAKPKAAPSPRKLLSFRNDPLLTLAERQAQSSDRRWR